LPQTNPYALALGVSTIVLILLIKRFKPLIPGALLALILGTVIAGYFQLNTTHNVSVVGDIPIGMPNPTLPIINLQAIPFLIGGAFGIVFLAVGETACLRGQVSLRSRRRSRTAGHGRGQYRIGFVSRDHD
jgi:SulP family sulfate permease